MLPKYIDREKELKILEKKILEWQSLAEEDWERRGQ